MRRRSGARIALLTRYPRPGEVKTRIAVELGDDAARELHERLARHCLRRAMALQATGEARVEVRTDASFQRAAREWLGKGPEYRYQGAGDLGDKLRLAFNEGFGRGGEKVVVVGSDCPRMRSEHLRQALRALDSADAVFGPASDGGYYLVGLRRDAAKRTRPRLFAEVEWGSADVLEQTLARAADAGLSHALLDELPDVDRPEDVADAEESLRAYDVTPASRVSVIVPALDEAAEVAGAISSALEAGADEVIVVDGGSCDGTAAEAMAAGARVMDAPRGRASQMNAGAAVAAGQILVFLHADTWLPAAAADIVREVLARPRVVAGAFDFAVRGAAPGERFVQAFGRIRTRIGVPYGDQALFVSRSVFEDTGGFPDTPVMEDHVFAHRLKRLGLIALAPASAATSPRAWRERGILRAAFVDASVIAGYGLGVDPERLAAWRMRVSRRSSDPNRVA